MAQQYNAQNMRSTASGNEVKTVFNLMAYTSDEYKYMLLRLLQRYIHMSKEKDRYYTISFFGKLFDDSVIITESAYKNFVGRMESEINYCAENNIYACENIPSAAIQEHKLFLIEAFAEIGIGLDIVTEDDMGTATFTKPNGEVMVYTVSSGTNYFYINNKSGTTYDYAEKSSIYYRMEDKEPLNISEIDTTLLFG